MIFVQKVTAITKVHSLLETLLLIYYLTWFICIFWGIIFSLVNASKNRLKVRHADWSIFTARKRSLGQGNIFAPVCHSVHRGICLSAFWDTTPPRSRYLPRDQVPPGADPPGRPPYAVHAGRYGQQAGGMHPTAMQSCWKFICIDSMRC